MRGLCLFLLLPALLLAAPGDMCDNWMVGTCVTCEICDMWHVTYVTCDMCDLCNNRIVGACKTWDICIIYDMCNKCDIYDMCKILQEGAFVTCLTTGSLTIFATGNWIICTCLKWQKPYIEGLKLNMWHLWEMDWRDFLHRNLSMYLSRWDFWKRVKLGFIFTPNGHSLCLRLEMFGKLATTPILSSQLTMRSLSPPSPLWLSYSQYLYVTNCPPGSWLECEPPVWPACWLHGLLPGRCTNNGSCGP